MDITALDECYNIRYYNGMELKVRKIGNSLGVILPKELLHALRVDEEGAVLHATETPDGFQITPYDPHFQEGLEAFRRVRSRYRDTLRELAK